MKPLHIVTYTNQPNGDWVCKCACGATWTQDKNKTQAELDDIYQRHVRVFERRMEIL